MRITLFEKRENFECIWIRYNPITENIGISNYYANSKREKEYVQSEKGREISRKSCKKYYWDNAKEISQERKEHYQNNKEKVKQRVKEHRQTESGRISQNKSTAKRRRNLGFTVLLENKFNCDVDYHHINNEYVIAVPRYIHRGTLGKNHRVECNSLVEKLYNIDIENEVEKYGKN